MNVYWHGLRESSARSNFPRHLGTCSPRKKQTCTKQICTLPRFRNATVLISKNWMCRCAMSGTTRECVPLCGGPLEPPLNRSPAGGPRPQRLAPLKTPLQPLQPPLTLHRQTQPPTHTEEHWNKVETRTCTRKRALVLLVWVMQVRQHLLQVREEMQAALGSATGTETLTVRLQTVDN